MSKINDYYKYDQEIDLKDFTSKKQDSIYVLTSVIVHQGSTTDSGHYFTYIDVGEGNWMKFNDEKVDNVDSSEVFEFFKGISTAYVLFYVKKSQLEIIKKKNIKIPPNMSEKFVEESCNIL
jgi:uncharacterized UBP type Zn finger protein